MILFNLILAPDLSSGNYIQLIEIYSAQNHFNLLHALKAKTKIDEYECWKLDLVLTIGILILEIERR